MAKVQMWRMRGLDHLKPPVPPGAHRYEEAVELVKWGWIAKEAVSRAQLK
ncbi:MAG: hypothetical protein ACRD06_04705 [Terriglobia bacterium]